ncbi:unnamed protein product [Lactuca saligna]|uniref:Replication factor A C-terminal domain-containing protein n=1 Tax=Lactuca saligna TaxID=75948 RepID=A0AA36E2M4_LACSI|nr:unnamed protein product [Lactuca saligna]
MAFYIKGPNFATLETGSSKLTPQDQKLTFVQETVVTECNDFSGSEFGFSFVDYQNVLSFAHPQDTSVDVISLVVAVAEMQRDHPYKSKHKLNINIQDAKGLQLHVNLWGDYAYKMQEYIHNNPHRPSVNTYFTSFKLFIKSDIDEIIYFNKSLDGDDGPDSSTYTSSAIPSNQLSEYDDFTVKNKLNAITEVWEPGENKKWYYQACTNCFGKGVPSDESDAHRTNSYVSRNENCTKTTTMVVPSFMIPIRVQDINGTLTLTMFKRDGKHLLKQSAKDLVKKMIEDAISGTDDNITPSTLDKNETTSLMKGLILK